MTGMWALIAQIDAGTDLASEPASPLFIVIAIGFTVVVVAAMWKVFTKAGKPGWAAIIPIYNVVIILQIAGKPLWWLILMLIPLVNIIVFIIVSIALAQNFGKGAGFGVGLALLGFIFYPILGFGDARYQPRTAAA